MTSAAADTQELTIGDLAARTGVTPATLRMWESRHGFPTPTRRSSGHRRYDEQDITLVRQVLTRRASGVRLDVAVREALASRRTMEASVFAELRRRQPQLAPQRLRKGTVLALTRAMEDEMCATAQRPLLFAAFQHGHFYKQARDRWLELSRTAERTVVMAAFDEAELVGGSTDSLQLVDLPGDAPMRREWSLVCDAPTHAAALAAWEIPGQRHVPDSDRVFETVWTLDPAAVRDAARACVGLVERLEPEAAHGFERLAGTPADLVDLRAANSVFGRLLAYVD